MFYQLLVLFLAFELLWIKTKIFQENIKFEIIFSPKRGMSRIEQASGFFLKKPGRRHQGFPVWHSRGALWTSQIPSAKSTTLENLA